MHYYGTKIKVEFNGSCLKQDSVTDNHRKVVKIYIVYDINKSINISSYPTLENCLFGAVSLTKMLISTGANTINVAIGTYFVYFR